MRTWEPLQGRNQWYAGKADALHIFSEHTTQVTTPFCKKRFKKGIFAEIYYLFASV
jgi:hypothetical protein